LNTTHPIVSLIASLMIMGSGPLPMDVWWFAQDDNALPLNPDWEYSREGKGLPDAGILCDHFPNRNGILYVQNCTSQQPVVDEPRPFHGIVPNDRYFACTYLKNVPNDLRSDSVHGHVNWTIATFTGAMSFTDFGFPPFADGDWDWLLETENKAGYLRSNDPSGIIAEFNGAEVADLWTTPWWTALRQTAMSSRHDPHAARAAAHELPAVVIGVLGIDTKHIEHAEVHPVYGLALRVAGNSREDTWELFARNWGNEGGCSNEQHNFAATTMSFLLPNLISSVPPGEFYHFDFRSNRSGLRWGIASSYQGDVITFELSPSQSHVLVYGEFGRCISEPCALNDGTNSNEQGFPLTKDDSISIVRHRWLDDSEPRTLVRDTQR
jgi:hypothetical protein